MYSDSNVLQEFQKQTRNILPGFQEPHAQPSQYSPTNYQNSTHNSNKTANLNTTSTFHNNQISSNKIRGISNSLSMRKLNDGVQSVLGSSC